MPSSTSKSKPKASEVAADTRRNYIPLIKNNYAHIYKTNSVLYAQPLEELPLQNIPRSYGRLPTFYVRDGDPAMMAIDWANHLHSQTGEAVPVPFICSANDKRPGGDWETGVSGSEERLCRRSTLSATLATPAPESCYQSNYPIPIEGGILSEDVVVFRGPHDRYEKLPTNEWGVLPVCSVPPVRWPKLTQGGKKYSFDEERDMVKHKLRAALRICVAKGYSTVVIGDFGLGNGYRNPPQEIAELWREVFLWDTDLRGRLQSVAFVFEDTDQCTTRLILDDLSKKSRHGGEGSRGKSSSSRGSSSSSSSSSSSFNYPTDFEIFQYVFSEEQISRAMREPDPRYDLGTLMSPQ
ncbi:hypothetical protein SEUCBS139899_002508 [Sporothrix eucalyptigena]|uniref:Microbial-type PARG catalytic domain-containing protein n=1 Tax=Sporothrix eucalyptigena TaxID=1812306 RepID=A0ABP0B4N4_9PEZI